MKAKSMWLVVFALVWSLSVTAGVAAEAKAPGDREEACAREVKALKGDRQARALEECLAGNGEGSSRAAALTPQQAKMKSCNAKAREREVRGDERRAFMSACLKG